MSLPPYRIGNKKFRRTLKTTCKGDADDDVQQFEINLRRVERGYLVIPQGADLVSFLLSNGHVAEPVAILERITLKLLFDRYFAVLPAGSLEESTIRTMTVHRGSLEEHFKKSKLVESIDLLALQEYVDKRSSDYTFC